MRMLESRNNNALSRASANSNYIDIKFFRSLFTLRALQYQAAQTDNDLTRKVQSSQLSRNTVRYVHTHTPLDGGKKDARNSRIQLKC